VRLWGQSYGGQQKQTHTHQNTEKSHKKRKAPHRKESKVVGNKLLGALARRMGGQRAGRTMGTILGSDTDLLNKMQ